MIENSDLEGSISTSQPAQTTSFPAPLRAQSSQRLNGDIGEHDAVLVRDLHNARALSQQMTAQSTGAQQRTRATNESSSPRRRGQLTPRSSTDPIAQNETQEGARRLTKKCMKEAFSVATENLSSGRSSAKNSASPFDCGTHEKRHIGNEMGQAESSMVQQPATSRRTARPRRATQLEL